MANLFQPELSDMMIKTRDKYKPTDKGEFLSQEDGKYNVKIEDVKLQTTKNNNPGIIIESTVTKTGELLRSLFVLNKEMQAVNIQHLRNLLYICDLKDFTKGELKDSDKCLEKLSETIGKKVQLELSTTETGFQMTEFIIADKKTEDDDDEYDDEDSDDEDDDDE